MTPRAVVIGAGIGGLTAAAGLHQAGWDVTVCERAVALTQDGPALVSTTAGDLAADLVVAADGIRSQRRAAIFPGHHHLRHAGFTTWRFLTDPMERPGPMSETWGSGTVFGVMPLSDGQVYCYAAARSAPGVRAGSAGAGYCQIGTIMSPIATRLQDADAPGTGGRRCGHSADRRERAPEGWVDWSRFGHEGQSWLHDRQPE